jgi:hypothetical protein
VIQNKKAVKFSLRTGFSLLVSDRDTEQIMKFSISTGFSLLVSSSDIEQDAKRTTIAWGKQ